MQPFRKFLLDLRLQCEIVECQVLDPGRCFSEEAKGIRAVGALDGEERGAEMVFGLTPLQRDVTVFIEEVVAIDDIEALLDRHVAVPSRFAAWETCDGRCTE